MLLEQCLIDPLEHLPVLHLVLAPAVPVGRQIRLQVREDQLDVKAPLAVVDQVQLIGGVLGPAEHLEGVGVLEALVVVECLEEQPEVHPRNVPPGVEVGGHAKLRTEGNTYVVVDAGSTNGTFVDDKRVSRQVLMPGQTIRFDLVQF